MIIKIFISACNHNVVDFSLVHSKELRAKALGSAVSSAILGNSVGSIVPIVNIKVKETPVIPAGMPITVACEAILKVPNDADKV